MPAPRVPAKVLAMRGSFEKNPQLTREDPEGPAPFDSQHPPAHLAQSVVPVWHELVVRLPKVALYNTDDWAVEIAATLMARWRTFGNLQDLNALEKWASKLGLSPGDRAKLGIAKPKNGNKNAFSDLD